eukprot:2745988-Alexandrium_andersonii.AAC.1
MRDPPIRNPRNPWLSPRGKLASTSLHWGRIRKRLNSPALKAGCARPNPAWGGPSPPSSPTRDERPSPRLGVLDVR